MGGEVLLLTEKAPINAGQEMGCGGSAGGEGERGNCVARRKNCHAAPAS